jgi:hypothetical protein
MDLLKSALSLANRGFYVFPLREGGKKPAIENFPEFATRDIDQIKIWWNRNPRYNIGISTSKYNGEGESLVAIDVDNKEGKKGDDELLAFELEGLDLPKTFEQVTPTGGRHLVYKTRESLGQSPLSNALDIRAHHGYIVGAGSIIGGKTYYCFSIEVRDATESLIALCKKAREKKPLEVVLPPVDQTRAIDRATFYLDNEAPLAIEGQHGDQTTFIVACKLKDFGLTPENSFSLMCDFWNERCSPPWDVGALKLKIENAYKYGKDFAGSSNPEVLFKPVEDEKEKDRLHPILELNKEYAFITVSGKAMIIHETKDIDGNFKIDYLSVLSFQQKLLPLTLMYNDKKHKVADLWLSSTDRRSYEGICFMPGQECPKNLYNLWRGFAIEPSDDVSDRAKKAVDMFFEHALENICQGDVPLYNWLIGYFAHLIQRPWEKPEVAPVFKGGKGIGKNFFVECIGKFLNSHYLLVSNSRYLVGNFNAHFENRLLFVLDEAFWSGDKKAEGTLKDLITGKTHFIERKGAEAYSIKNCTRVVIIGNEQWLIPASHDERRFAVFNVGEKRKNDQAYFTAIRKGMEAGGYQYLLRVLKDFDLSETNVNTAPSTRGLIDQKIASLSPFYEWWFECLLAGRLVSSDFATDWPEEIEKDRLRTAYRAFVKERNLKMWGESDRTIGKLLSVCLPTVKDGKKQIDDLRVNTYVLPNLDTARKAWEKHINATFTW